MATPPPPPKTKIYLASRSPRRRELLKQIDVSFEVLVLREHPARGLDVDESVHPGESPADYVRRVARAKAEVGWRRIEQRRLRRFPVLGADTAVCLGEEILGKPADRADAARMLRMLSGREHRVLTAVALKFEDHVEEVASESRVRFCELSDGDIQAYLKSGEATDKAGAYAIQGRAAGFVTEIHGSYTGIMGLPLHETAQLIRKFRT
jgi:septum formation protein